MRLVNPKDEATEGAMRIKFGTSSQLEMSNDAFFCSKISIHLNTYSCPKQDKSPYFK